jgi:hypothetical protein
LPNFDVTNFLFSTYEFSKIELSDSILDCLHQINQINQTITQTAKTHQARKCGGAAARDAAAPAMQPEVLVNERSFQV